MSSNPEKKDQNPEFLEDGSRPNDFIDGIAITSVMVIIISSIMYYLYTM